MYWLLLVVCGILGGAAVTLALRPPFDGALWLAASLGTLGVVGVVFALFRIFSADAGEQEGADANFLPARHSTGPVLSLDQAAGLYLNILERVLELLRIAGDPESLDAIVDFVTRVEGLSAELTMSGQGDRFGAQASRRLLDLSNRFGDLQRKVLVKAGRDPGQTSTRITLQDASLDIQELSGRLTECSRQLSRLAGQFDKRPELKEGLMAIAQALGAYVRARGGRLSSSLDEEIALAPTVRMPDLRTIEKLAQELGELEEAAQDPAAPPDRLEGTKETLARLVEATRPLRDGYQPDEIAEVADCLREAAEALDAGQVQRAREKVSRVLEIVRMGS